MDGNDDEGESEIDGNDDEGETEARGRAQLRVIAETAIETPVPLDGALPIRVSLVNEDTTARTVNRRLEPGYRDSLSRELFVELVDAASGEPASIDRVDYDRTFPRATDYVRLEPGERLPTEFDLLEWYPLREPGRYRATIAYQADEELATPPDDVVTGVYRSRPFEFTVGPPADG